MDTKTFDQQLAKVALKLFKAVGTDVSRECERKFTSGDIRGLLDLKVDPSGYADARSYLADAQCVSLFKKLRLDDVVSAKERRAKALENFWTAEKECASTNVRFSRALHNQALSLEEFRMFVLLEPAKRWIANFLGRVPNTLEGRFGPGSTYGDKGRLTTISDKMSSHPTITEEARCFLPLWQRTGWFRALCSDMRRSDPVTIRGNRFTTVPKDATKDRGICIEPGVNLFYQLALGRHLKKCFRAHGVDLNQAQREHRKLAAEGSLWGNYATIDLSNASDTVAYQLVKWLLPPDWFDVFSSLRSSHTRVNGKWVKLEKFSSMGNGFTFELETLIFSSLIHAVSGLELGSFRVFGDDIIVPSGDAHNVIAVLKFCGFTPNPQKTFLDGPFRESCGGDFFRGTAVRPHFLKEIPNEPQHWIGLANGIRRMGCQDPSVDFRYSIYRSCWYSCLDALPSPIRRLRGPETLGDLVVHDEGWSGKRRGGVMWVRVYRPLSRRIPLVHWTPNVVYATALYLAGNSGACFSRGALPRDSVTGYKVGYAVVPS